MFFELASFFLVAPALIPNVMLEPILQGIDRFITGIPRLLYLVLVVVAWSVIMILTFGFVFRFIDKTTPLPQPIVYLAGFLSFIVWPVMLLIYKEDWVKLQTKKLLEIDRQKRLLFIGVASYLIGWTLQFFAS